MPRFTLTGRVVTHTARPRFTATFSKNDDGGWEAFDDAMQFIDDPPKAAAILTRLMREAGDFFGANFRRDWIQEAVITRAAKLELSSYEIAKRTGGAVSEDHVRDYITRSKSMGSHKLQHVLTVLELKITE